ncbi:RNA polymerase sigma factor [Phenylobacterium sp.]|jgi:RNA polymerase sigma factor (sigma-70 family)|uniref:RNA polymerase sigma factor n=1 Tax=Phenylobacterium sp. TaxID=1871053 RepID=UPI00378316F9
MRQMNSIAAWAAANFLPHEADVRRWLRRSGVSPAQSDDLIQEAYARLLALDSFDHIASGRAYFFTTVKSVLRDQIRRARIVDIESVAEIAQLRVADDEPSVEVRFADRQCLALVRRLVDDLPDRCRQVFKLRKIEGLSQKETAEKLNITENVVEKEVARGIRTVLAGLSERSHDFGFLPDKWLNSVRARDKRRD